jgi:small ligand-binding sensory domain FIST
MDWPDARVETWIVDETFEIPADLGTAGGCLLMGNPLRLNAAMLLEDLNRRHPGLAVFGGLAGGSWEPGELFLLHDGMDATDAAGLLVSIGGLTVRGIVSQGCQPIGEPLTITRVQDDMVYAVGGRPAYEVLVEAVESLPEQDKAEARGNIMAGLAASEYVEEFRRGDFLVRNIIGGDPQTGALRLGAVPRVGQTLQFQIRERDAADEDLRQRSADAADHWGSPSALLLFSCAGRGQGLFGVPNHDAGLLADNLGPVPAAGFFCSGEFGPVAGLNFLHGYTASAMLFYPTAAASGK